MHRYDSATVSVTMLHYDDWMHLILGEPLGPVLSTEHLAGITHYSCYARSRMSAVLLIKTVRAPSIDPIKASTLGSQNRQRCALA